MQLLLLVYTAQSFVLLTANIEDIKKLARKFVPDNIADQLADFVAKATGNINNQMDETQDIFESKEYALRDIVRQREKGDKTHKGRKNPNYLSNESRELSIERDERDEDNEKNWQKYDKDLSIERKEKRETSTTRNWWDNFEDVKESERPIGNKREKNNYMSNNELASQERSKSNYINQYYTQSKSLFQTLKPGKSQNSELIKLDKRISELKRLSDSISDAKPNDKFASGKQPLDSRFKKIRDRDSRILTFDFKPVKYQKSDTQNHERREAYERQKDHGRHRDHETSAEVHSGSRNRVKDHDHKTPGHSNESDGNELWDFETTRFRGLSVNHGEAITTKKEKTDFDQYDNRNYPKADFIATSGNMMLPKIQPKAKQDESKSWWEKELKLPNAAQLKTWLATM